MLPMPNLLQLQLLQQQMGGGGGYMYGFEDEMYDIYDPMLYWMQGYDHGNIHGQFQGFDQAAQYYQMQMLQQMQLAQRMQMMGYGGHAGYGVRSPRRRGWKAMQRMRLMGGGVRAGGRALMGSPFGMDAMRGNQLALMASPWGGGV